MLYRLSYFREIFHPEKSRASFGIAELRMQAFTRLAQNFRKKISAFVWVRMDSNHRSRKTADLQSAPFGHSGTHPHILKNLWTNLMVQSDLSTFQCPLLGASSRTRTNDRWITNLVLYQLSYRGVRVLRF